MPGTILVADDSPTMQRRASSILESDGLEVVTVANGVAAIKKLATVNPLLVLADVSMPGRDGYEVCQIVKQSPETRHIPVLLIFSDVDPYDRARGAQVGADGSVKKPFVDEELREVVKRITDQAQAAAPPPRVMAPPPQPPAPTFEAFETEPEPEPAPGFSSVPEGIAFASDVPVVTPEPALHEPETFASEPSQDQALETQPVTESAQPYEPPIAAFEATATETEQAEPAFVEEPLASFEEPHEHPHPHEHEDIFHSPGEIAEPVLAEELETPTEAVPAAMPEAATEPASEALGVESVQSEEAAAEEPPPTSEEPPSTESTFAEAAAPATPEVLEVEPEAAVAAEAQSDVVSPSQEETMSLPSTPEAAEETTPPASNITGGIETSAAAVSREQVYRIVREVVVKMSPSALPSSTIEDLAQRFTEEIIAGLHN